MAFTTYPAAGQTLTASILSTLIGEVRPRRVRKSADETLSNSTSLQDDDELVLSVVSGVTYQLKCLIYYGAGTTADFKAAFTHPGGTLEYAVACLDTAAATSQTVSLAEASGSAKSFGGAGVASFRYLWYDGMYACTSSGSLQFQWAQNSAVVESTVVKAGSFLWLKQTV